MDTDELLRPIEMILHSVPAPQLSGESHIAAIAKVKGLPKPFAGNVAACRRAVLYATMMRESLLRVMLHMDPNLDDDRPAFSIDFFFARLRAGGHIEGTAAFEIIELDDEPTTHGLPNIAAVASVTDKVKSIEVGESFNIGEAISNGWATPTGDEGRSPYTVSPAHRCKTRALTYLIRRHYPEIMQGCPEKEEVQDARNAALDPYEPVIVEPAVPEESTRDITKEEHAPALAHGGISKGLEGTILEWMQEARVDARAVNRYMKETYRVLGVVQLDESQGNELLSMLQAGDFDNDEG